MTHKELLEKYKNLFSEDFLSDRGEHRFFESKLPFGWLSLINKFLYLANQVQDNRFKINQIKEKFGSLRIYYQYQSIDNNPNETITLSNMSKYFDGLVDMAESFSKMICQECGSSNAKLYKNNNWLMTLCHSHINSK